MENRTEPTINKQPHSHKSKMQNQISNIKMQIIKHRELKRSGAHWNAIAIAIAIFYKVSPLLPLYNAFTMSCTVNPITMNPTKAAIIATKMGTTLPLPPCAPPTEGAPAKSARFMPGL